MKPSYYKVLANIIERAAEHAAKLDRTGKPTSTKERL